MATFGTLLSPAVLSLRRPERAPLDAWADRYRVLSGKDTAKPGPWRTDQVPYVRRIMRCFEHPGVRMIAWKKASQVGASALLITFMLWSMDQRPGPSLAMLPNLDLARDYNRDRIMPALLSCRAASRHLPGSPRDLKNLKLTLDAMWLRLVGANSPAGRRSWPCRDLYLDEVGAYEDPEWVEVLERSKTFDDSKTVLFSTPGDEGTGIDPWHDLGSREQFHVPCPHCGHYQVLVFAGLKWDGGGNADPESAKQTARYVCQSGACGTPIYEWHKAAMLAKGVWVPRGPKKAPAPRAVGDVLEHGEGSAGPGRERERVSFHLSSLYSPFGGATWGDVAAKFVENRGVMTRKYVNGWLGEDYQVSGDRIEVGELRRLCIPKAREGYSLGECPLGVRGLVMAVDVQADCLYVGVRGFGERGIDSWLIDRQRIDRKLGGDLLELDGFLGLKPGVRGALKRYPALGLPKTFGINCGGIDSGKFTDEVYTCVRRLRAAGLKVVAVKGQGVNRTPMADPYRLKQIDVWPDGSRWAGRPMVPGCPLLNINSDLWKTRLVARMKSEPDEGELEGLAPGQIPGWYLPENTDGCLEQYLDYVTAEHRKEDRGTEQEPKPLSYVWAMRPGRTGNHDFDWETYCLAVADYFGIRRLGERAPEPESIPAAPPDEPGREPRFGAAPFGKPPWAQ